MIKLEKLYEQTNGGADLFQAYFPDFDPGKTSNLVKLRDDDDHPSASIFPRAGKWFIKDHGGSDNKAKDMVAFVEEREHLEFKDALVFIAKTCGLAVDEEASHAKRGAIMSKVAPSNELRLIRRKSGKFTKKELSILGATDRNGEPCITQETCDEFGLVPLDGVIYKTKDGESSWKVEATDDFPIMYYDRGDFGRIYQPFGDTRFMYYGKKPEHFIFGCKLFEEAWEKAKNGIYPHVPDFTARKKKEGEDDGLLDDDKDERWEALTICSGGSDALNVYRAGHVVCWPNSESEPLTADVIRKLMRLTRNLYVLYDADETGLRNAYNLALRNLDVKIISLPKDLGQYPTGKRDKDGKPKMCKDIKDYCMYYKKGHIDPYKEFKHKLVKLAKPLRFWTESKNKDGKLSCEISNAHLYNFLSANGFARMRTNDSGGVVYVYSTGRIVEVISEDDIVARVRQFLIEYIKENAEYYSTQLENTIYRTKQINMESMKCIDETQPDFEAFDARTEYFFFRNCIVRVNADGIALVKDKDCPYSVLKHKVIDHDLRLTEPLFDAGYTDDWLYGQELLAKNPPDTPNRILLDKEIDNLTKENKKYRVALKSDFDFVRFVWNIGNKFWKEEEEARRNGSELTSEEKRIIGNEFLNKCTTLGYLLCKFKDDSRHFAVYGMETAVLEEDEGGHKGGTGKSLFFKSVMKMRQTIGIDGQAMKPDKLDFLYQLVNFDTDIINVDDINKDINMNHFLSAITGDLHVNTKHGKEVVIPYAHSPKFIFTSNHPIRGFDNSLRRRIQFVSFSDYYHSAGENGTVKERKPSQEFGRNLVTDYDEKDMNLFYNFMLQCVHSYMRFGLVEPFMPDIEIRQKRAAVGVVFIDWADNYLEPRINSEIDKREAFQNMTDYVNKLKVRNSVDVKNFSKKVRQWCEIRGFAYNPSWWMATLSESDQKRNVKRVKDDITKENKEFFYIQGPAQDTTSTMAATNTGATPF